MRDWITTLVELQRQSLPAVVVTIASVKGSAPRPPGTRMLVTADVVHGTIGGGHLEFTAIDIARRQLEGGASAQLQRFPLGASLGQCCGGVVNLLFEVVAGDAAWVQRLAALRAQGGELVVVTTVTSVSRAALEDPANSNLHEVKLFVTERDVQGSLGSASLDAAAVAVARNLLTGDKRARLVSVADAGSAAGAKATEATEATRSVPCFFDPILPPDFNIVLFGAGHVGRALVSVLAGVPCRVAWIDTRDDAFPPAVPDNVAIVSTDAPEAEIDAAAPGSYFLVMTHNHALDEQLSERILRRADFAYFGLIGSVPKRRQFERRLAARGIPAESLMAMVCPIGVGGISGKEPGVIAIAVAAEVLQRRSAASAAGTTNTSSAVGDQRGSGIGSSPGMAKSAIGVAAEAATGTDQKHGGSTRW
jgi:xanthine dehydrogenase accessory factor